MKSFAARTTADKAAAQTPSKGVALPDNRAGAMTQRQTQAAIAESPRQVAQRQQAAPAVQRKNTTGLPDKLKAGVENLSGHSLDDVTVHYNSPKPAQLKAHAYAQGTNIHVAPGQEKHLPHEAWHVAQQKQGRVQATRQLKDGISINDSSTLEKEADIMGTKSLQMKGKGAATSLPSIELAGSRGSKTSSSTVQRIAYKQEEVEVNYKGKDLKVKRTKEVEGSIKITGTSGRPPAPNPFPYTEIEQQCGLKNGDLMRYSGYDKGHVMALELGGEDVPQNIVPQWGNWQRTGPWRLNEVKAKKGKYYKVVVEYSGRKTGIKPLVPTDFLVTIDGKPSTLENEPVQGDLNETPKEEARYTFERELIKAITQDAASGTDITSANYVDKITQYILTNYPTYKKPTPKVLAEARKAAREAEEEFKMDEGSLEEYFVGEAGLVDGLKGPKAKAIIRAEKIFRSLLKEIENSADSENS